MISLNDSFRVPRERTTSEKRTNIIDWFAEFPDIVQRYSIQTFEFVYTTSEPFPHCYDDDNNNTASERVLFYILGRILWPVRSGTKRTKNGCPADVRPPNSTYSSVLRVAQNI